MLMVKFKKLNNQAFIPRYAKEGDAGLDMFCISVNKTVDYIEYDTGIALEIPKGYVGLLFPRSSNSKKDLLLCNSVGVIDSGFRGSVRFRFKTVTNELKVKVNASIYEVGDACGQLMIIPYPTVELLEVEELVDTERGEGCFGSSNKI